MNACLQIVMPCHHLRWILIVRKEKEEKNMLHIKEKKESRYDKKEKDTEKRRSNNTIYISHLSSTSLE